MEKQNQPTISLRGVFPPVPTLFDAKGEVAELALKENIARLNAFDLSGYVVLGSNGEAGFLSVEEKVRVWAAARAAIPPDKLMLAGAGCESTRQTIDLSRRAADAGADAVLLVTPHYYGGRMTPDALVRHYQAVADAISIPVVLYTVPKFTHVDLDAATIARAAGHPN
ncbi:MAG TPA: dihydrodipicolinate synthase family protein, partial [Chloroflexi bacterium]|nr:dihydrodipicolinate synthase family protein [Chloroflexota bacterium]